MRNISIIRNYNDLVKDYENALTRIDKAMTLIEQEGGNKGWEIEKRMPEVMVEAQIEKLYNILKGD